MNIREFITKLNELSPDLKDKKIYGIICDDVDDLDDCRVGVIKLYANGDCVGVVVGD